MMKRILLLSFVILFSFFVEAQTKADTNAIDNTPAKSGLSYEALTQFFQANITAGKTSGYDFKATLFGIKSFFSKDSLNASSIYLKNETARNLEFALGLHKGSDGNLSLLSGAIKYALINNRDKSEYNFSERQYGLADDIYLILRARDSALRVYQKEIGKDVEKNKELDAADERFKKSQDIKEFPKRVQDLYNVYLKNHGKDPAKFLKSVQDIYDRIAKEIDKKALLTISFNPEYDWNNSRFDTTTINLQYLIGFGNPLKPWNIDLKGTQLFQHDSVSKKKDLSRSVSIATVGINKVLVCDSKYNPLIEFELAYEDDYVWSGLYAKENRNQPKLVNTLRVHITKEISLPVTLKYDLKKPNLLGIFRLQWDLQGNKKS